MNISSFTLRDKLEDTSSDKFEDTSSDKFEDTSSDKFEDTSSDKLENKSSINFTSTQFWHFAAPKTSIFQYKSRSLKRLDANQH